MTTTTTNATWVRRATASEQREMADIVADKNRDEKYGTVWTLERSAGIWCAAGRNAEQYGNEVVCDAFYRCPHCGAVDCIPVESTADDVYCWECHELNGYPD